MIMRAGLRRNRYQGTPFYRNVLSVVLLALCVATWMPGSVQGATITVNTAADPGEEVALCSLRSAILAANTDAVVYGCAAGSGTDTIVFDASAYGTITLGAALPTITQGLTVTGPGREHVTIDGVGAWRSGLKVTSAIVVNISGLTMTNGLNDDGFSGAAIYNQAGTVAVDDCALTNNTSTGAVTAGAIFNNNGTFAVTNCLLSGNEGPAGGGIRSSGGTFTLADSTLFANVANSGHGGGINVSGGVAAHTVSNCTFQANKAENIVPGAYDGGAVYNGSNKASGSGLWIYNSTFNGNEADRRGGAIKNEGSVDIYNSTFYGNRAGNGGAVQSSAGTMSFVNCTVSGNLGEAAGAAGGGIFLFGATPADLQNTILAGNTTTDGDAPDCAGTPTSLDYNLLGNNDGCSMVAGANDQIGTSGSPIDPLLGSLGDYGGTTQTLLLCVAADSRAAGQPCDGVAAGDSPALDVIVPAADACGSCDPPDPGNCVYERDQRNIARPSDVKCDIGAYERTAATLVELVSFTATAMGSSVMLSWETASEIDTAGFHLWRSESGEDAYVRITESLIPAQGGPAQGALYAYEDPDVDPGVYGYMLEDVDDHGTGTLHGPVPCTVPGEGEPEPWGVGQAEAATVGGAGSMGLSRGLGLLGVFVLALAAVFLLRGAGRKQRA